VIELRDERETYLIAKHLEASVPDDPAIKPKMFCLAVTMQGKPFLWPVRVPVDDTVQPDKWMVKPLEAIRMAKDQWVRIAWDERMRQHRIFTCDSTVEPEWPDLSPKQVMTLAFQNFLITTLDHPVLRRLGGEQK
jgi:hypothetical protein